MSDILSHKVSSRSLVDVLDERIEAVIISGDLQPGSKVREQTLATSLGVSRGPLREAIRRLNKTELIDHIASKADISKAAAGRSLDALIGAVKTTLKKGGTVTLVGFGTFAVSARAARTGRNPRTGETIKIKKAKVPKFRPGKALKDAVN